MICHVLTLFPEVIESYVRAGVLGKAAGRGLIEVRPVQIRDFATDRHNTVDDTPYGGGAGMVMKADVVHRAIEHARAGFTAPDTPVILTSPHGRLLTHAAAGELSRHGELCILCGHYGGVDERVRGMVTDEISIGDFVVTGGELPALVILDAVARLIPGVLGNEDSAKEDSHADGLLGPPAYTRPPEYLGEAVPEVLLSGNHARVGEWRRREKLKETFLRRPELLDRAALAPEDIKYLETIGWHRKEK